MRLIKLAILSFVFLFLLVTIISLFIPGNIRISKAKNFAADDKTYFQNIEQLNKWRNWHPALKEVPENEITILKDGSIKVKDTRISVIERKPEEVITEILQHNGRPVISGFKIINHAERDSSTLQWYMDFKLRWYPWEKFKSLFYESFYGPQMEQGLTNLKQLNEASRSSSN
jgi:hypothetical protein